jgi:hypothetical protein
VGSFPPLKSAGRSRPMRIPSRSKTEEEQATRGEQSWPQRHSRPRRRALAYVVARARAELAAAASRPQLAARCGFSPAAALGKQSRTRLVDLGRPGRGDGSRGPRRRISYPVEAGRRRRSRGRGSRGRWRSKKAEG